MALRIGVNLGDIIEQDGALYGEGVNVAARLQALARPRGYLRVGQYHHSPGELMARNSNNLKRRKPLLSQPS